MARELLSCPAERFMAKRPKRHLPYGFELVSDTSRFGTTAYTRKYRVWMDGEPTKAVITFYYNERNKEQNGVRLNKEGVKSMLEVLENGEMSDEDNKIKVIA